MWDKTLTLILVSTCFMSTSVNDIVIFFFGLSNFVEKMKVLLYGFELIGLDLVSSIFTNHSI
jgi:hypothetical protein